MIFLEMIAIEYMIYTCTVHVCEYRLHVCTYTCMWIYMCTCTCRCIYMYMYVHIHVRVMYTCECIHINVYQYLQNNHEIHVHYISTCTCTCTLYVAFKTIIFSTLLCLKWKARSITEYSGPNVTIYF